MVLIFRTKRISNVNDLALGLSRGPGQRNDVLPNRNPRKAVTPDQPGSGLQDSFSFFPTHRIQGDLRVFGSTGPNLNHDQGISFPGEQIEFADPRNREVSGEDLESGPLEVTRRHALRPGTQSGSPCPGGRGTPEQA